MSESTSDLTPVQLFLLGLAKADNDLEGQLATIRVARDAGRISAAEAATKAVLWREVHAAEIARLRNEYLPDACQ